MYVGAACVRAVLLRDGAPVWWGEVERAAGHGLVDELERLLSGAPRVLRRTPLVIAVSPTASQLKQLVDLPPITDNDLLTAIVRERRRAFFRSCEGDIAVTGVHVDAVGTVWAGAIEWTTISTLVEAARSCNVRIHAVVPLGVALQKALPRGEWEWRADGFLLRSTPGAAFPTTQREWEGDEGCTSTDEPHREAPDPASVYADAIGAGRIDRGDMLVVDAKGSPPSVRRQRARAFLVPGLLACVGILAVLLSPLSGLIAQRRAAASLQTVQTSPEWMAYLRMQTRLAEATAALNAITDADRSRLAALSFLRSLLESLPESTSITSLELDQTGGRLSLITTSPDTVNARLGRSFRIDGSAIDSTAVLGAFVMEIRLAPARSATERHR